MRSRRLVALVVLASAALLAGCESEPEEPEQITVTYSDVEDLTGSEWYTVPSPVVGRTNILGDWEIVLPFDISHANGTAFDPKAVVRGPDGTSVTCYEEDLRRKPHLVKTTTDWTFPCESALPTDPEGVTVTVTDEYN